jgi:hypothetical protein
MKDFISTSYIFTPGASGVGTVNLSGIENFDQKKLVAIINQTRSGTVIYATGSANTRYTAISGSTLTLFVDTSTYSANDILQVIYNDTDTPQKVSDNIIQDFLTYIKQIVFILSNTIGNIDILNRLKVRAELVDTVTTVTGVTTVTTVTGVTTVAAVTNIPT